MNDELEPGYEDIAGPLQPYQLNLLRMAATLDILEAHRGKGLRLSQLKAGVTLVHKEDATYVQDASGNLGSFSITNGYPFVTAKVRVFHAPLRR